MCLALFLRLLFLGGKSLWGDEFYAAGLVSNGIENLIQNSFRGSPHPPLAFIAIKLSSAVFGNSEAGLRAVSAIVTSWAAVPLYFFVLKRSGKWPAAFSALLWVMAPYSVSMGQEAWLYGIMSFLMTYASMIGF